MHPFMRSVTGLLLYLGTVALVGSFLSIAVARVGNLELFGTWLVVTPATLLFGFVALGTWFACRALPLQGDRVVRIVAIHLLSGVAVSLAFSWLVSLMLGAGHGTAAAAGLFGDSIVPAELLMTSAALLYLLIVTINYLLLQLEASREAHERALRLSVAAREAEIRAFRSQINPHFLFNSLNSISSLCGSDPSGARRMTEELASFFRSTVRAGARPVIQLRDEIDLVERYLAIESIRFGERLVTRMSIDPASIDCLVPPLTLQPLVENAIRHGIAHRLDGGKIEISAKQHGEILTLRVINDVDPDRVVRPGEGVGIRNVRERLQQTFEGRSSMIAEEKDERFTVTLSVPARREGEDDAEDDSRDHR